VLTCRKLCTETVRLFFIPGDPLGADCGSKNASSRFTASTLDVSGECA
jgi:hypothetical protein